tara:strand:+ start:448 stop:873 length:426 start_codon:yes stop_codon:yes gene_type:complete
MNSLFLLIIGLPLAEIWLMIKIGQQIGAINTVLLIILTAFLGIYYARIEGLNTIKSGLLNVYENKTPLYEVISGASIGIAVIMLILPGFITDTIGFILLIPFTRKLIINFLIKNKRKHPSNENNFVEGEILEEDKKDKDEL